MSTSEKNEKLVRIVFRIFKHCNDTTEEYVGIFGSHPVVDNWDFGRARPAEYIGKSEWHLEVFIPENVTLVYKLFTFKPVKSSPSNRSNRQVRWTPSASHEEPGTREINIGVQSIKLEMTYGEPGEQVSEMVSHLTKTGHPINIHVKPT